MPERNVEIILAKSAGFCFGVEKAVDEVYNLVGQTGEEKESVYTYGEIIHNEAVVDDLGSRGVKIIDDDSINSDGGHTDAELPDKGTVVIRSHGVSRKVYENINKKGLKLIDATCPFVTRIHKIVKKASENGSTIVVFGHATHAEVRGITGWVEGKCFVIENVEDAKKFSEPTDISITMVSQTTMNPDKFKETVEIFKEEGYNVCVENTICYTTGERQQEAMGIAEHVDVMIVIGGAHSSNTRGLFDVCARKCERTYLIQGVGDLRGKLSGKERRIGITAGASTPLNIIEEVQTYVRTGTVI